MKRMKKVLCLAFCICILTGYSLSTKAEIDVMYDPYPPLDTLIPSDMRVIYFDWKSSDYSQNEMELYEELDEAINNFEADVCVVGYSFLNYDTLGSESGYPYFWLQNLSNSFAWGKDDDGEMVDVNYFHFSYHSDMEEKEQMQQEVDTATAEILGMIPGDANDWEASKIVHDELIRRVTYDQTKSSPHAHDIYGALVEGSAVCQGYAYAFSHVMNAWCRQNGETYNYPTVISETHGWTFCDGFFSDDNYLDVTWDDNDMCDQNGKPYITYDYFGLSRETMEIVDEHGISGVEGKMITTIGDSEQFPGNYHRHEGYYLYDYDYGKVLSIFSEQYESGSNLLTVKFENEEDYDYAKSWKDNDCQEIGELLNAIGYHGSSVYWTNDLLYTVNIGLYAPQM